MDMYTRDNTPWLAPEPLPFQTPGWHNPSGYPAAGPALTTSFPFNGPYPPIPPVQPSHVEGQQTVLPTQQGPSTYQHARHHPYLRAANPGHLNRSPPLAIPRQQQAGLPVRRRRSPPETYAGYLSSGNNSHNASRPTTANATAAAPIPFSPLAGFEPTAFPQTETGDWARAPSPLNVLPEFLLLVPPGDEETVPAATTSPPSRERPVFPQAPAGVSPKKNRKRAPKPAVDAAAKEAKKIAAAAERAAKKAAREREKAAKKAEKAAEREAKKAAGPAATAAATAPLSAADHERALSASTLTGPRTVQENKRGRPRKKESAAEMHMSVATMAGPTYVQVQPHARKWNRGHERTFLDETGKVLENLDGRCK
ncbi:MAG: hypothetical protein Q9208_001029 [Pyrenodesmia sp. 3 TL-2023]